MRTVQYLLVAAGIAILVSPWFATLAMALPKDGP
jgi:hypothetical protein